MKTILPSPENPSSEMQGEVDAKLVINGNALIINDYFSDRSIGVCPL